MEKLSIELSKEMLEKAINMAIASNKRATTNNLNPLIKQILEEDIKRYMHGLASIKAIK